jgi:integrase
VTTRVADLTERLKLGRRRFKSLRHSAATTMLADGVPLEVVSRTLGHAGLEITANIYARVLLPAQRDAADRLQEALGAS